MKPSICLSGVLTASLVFIVIASVSADDGKSPRKATGFLDFNYYYDTRDFNVLTINALANITNRVQYFSLTNYTNSIGTTNNLDKNAFYSEQNIRWLAVREKIPTDLTLQWVIRNPDENDLLRFGFRVRVSAIEGIKNIFKALNTFYSVNFHLLQIDHVDGFDWQIEHIYKIFPDILGKRLYLSGFVDHNINSGKSTVVTEHQLGFRVIDQFYLVSEYRYKGSLNKEKSGVGLGVEYKILF